MATASRKRPSNDWTVSSLMPICCHAFFVAAPCMCKTVLRDHAPRGAARALPNNTAITHAKRPRSIAVQSPAVASCAKGKTPLHACSRFLIAFVCERRGPGKLQPPERQYSRQAGAAHSQAGCAIWGGNSIQPPTPTMASVPPFPMLGKHSGLVTATLALHLCTVRNNNGREESVHGSGVGAGEQPRRLWNCKPW